MSARVLLFVAHPDDDAIFAGALQHRASMYRWHAVSLTYCRDHPRAQEMSGWQRFVSADTSAVSFLGFDDDYEDRRQGRCSIDFDAACRSLEALDQAPDVVVTHGPLGEYGHPHHQLAHRIATACFPNTPMLVFAPDVCDPCIDLKTTADGGTWDKWGSIRRAYPSQAHVIQALERPRERFAAHRPVDAQRIRELLLEP